MTTAALHSVIVGSLALVVSCATVLVAEPPPPPGSLDTWVPACEADAPDLQALLENEAVIVPVEAITQHGDGTFSIAHQPFVETAGGDDLCPSSPLYEETQVRDTPFRSAFQVGPDLLLTAWHAPFNPHLVEAFVVVFGLQSRQVGDTCVPATFEHIPASHLFAITELVADGHPPEGSDAVLLRLDRAIGAAYPRVRRSGRGWPGDSVTAIGHPERLGARVDIAGVAGATEVFEGYEALNVANVHILVGSSGSMLYNRTQRVLETAVNHGGSAFYQPSGACFVLVHQDLWSDVGASLRYFAKHIPAFELVVDSLDPVLNVTSLGGALPHPSTTRAVTAPDTATGPIAYQIVPPVPAPPGEPTLTITPAGPLQGTLAPDTGFAIQEDVSIHGVASCGVYERSYLVRDLTHGFEDRARHLFELGLREFTVSAQDGRNLEDLALPLDPTVNYTVRNPRPDAVTVLVTADEDWVTLNGVPGDGGPPSLELHLDPGASAVVTVGGGAVPLPEHYPETFEAVISFDFAPATPCPVFAGPVTRFFKFKLGVETFTGTGGPIPTGSILGLTVGKDVPEDFCVGDLDVAVQVTGVPATQVVALMTAPATPQHAPIQQVLWSQGALSPPADPLIVTLDDEADEKGEVEPYAPLGVFDDEAGRGVWTFKLVNVGPAAGAVLAGWSLRFTAASCP